jgi:hypothetical protein
MSPADIVKLRLDAQRISATTFTRPAEVVAWLGAVQAQDYLGALWAVGLRLTRACEQDIERALADRSIVRTWPMRGTLHFVAAADARWMLDLLAPKVVTGAAGRFRALDLDDATIARARRVLAKRLQGAPLTRPAVYDVLERAKISTVGQRGIHILWRLAHECLLCFGPREGKQQTFVLFDEWLPRAKRLPREEALAELAWRYFTGHGPATVTDFAWWSGLKLSDARLGVHLAAPRLAEETFGGRTHCIARPALPRVPPACIRRVRRRLCRPQRGPRIRPHDPRERRRRHSSSDHGDRWAHRRNLEAPPRSRRGRLLAGAVHGAQQGEGAGRGARVRPLRGVPGSESSRRAVSAEGPLRPRPRLRYACARACACACACARARACGHAHARACAPRLRGHSVVFMQQRDGEVGEKAWAGRWFGCC